MTYICSYDMLICMRTTLNLDDRLFREIKRLAAETRQTLTAVIQDALRERLARRERSRGEPRPPLPVYGGRGLQPGVDLDSSAGLLDIMEGRR